ncbi:MAG: flagellar biosynthetic protein FliO [Fibrobacter sp.]|nr:flagellar biosynthetic protein FliO [Fibrobacter sp.]
MLKPKILLLVLMLTVVSAAQNSDSSLNDAGNFDIRKVRSAIIEQNDTSVAEQSYVNGQKSENYILVLLRICLYLLLVIGLIFGVAWLLKKGGITSGGKLGGNVSMDILEILPLGQNRSIVLVRVMDAVYLLSQTQTNISMIDKIENEKAIELISSSKEGGSVMQFKDAFNNFIEKIKKPV